MKFLLLDYDFEKKKIFIDIKISRNFFIPGSWTKKLPMIEDTTLTIEIDSGTIDATEYNLAFHVQQLSSKIGIEKRYTFQFKISGILDYKD